jgi:hypothetical protein
MMVDEVLAVLDTVRSVGCRLSVLARGARVSAFLLHPWVESGRSASRASPSRRSARSTPGTNFATSTGTTSRCSISSLRTDLLIVHDYLLGSPSMCCVFRAPCVELSDQGAQALAQWSEGVLDARRHLGVDASLDDAILLQFPELPR